MIMKRRPSVDRVLAQPHVRAQFEQFRHHFAVAAGRHDEGDADGYQAALAEGRIVGWRIVGAITAIPENGNLPGEEVFRYLKNVAMQEMIGARAKQDRIILSELVVKLPRGRRPTQRPKARQQLIDEIRAQPGMSVLQIAARARALGAWGRDQADDPASKHKRIVRLRRDATK
jgi:hypothetical protein